MAAPLGKLPPAPDELPPAPDETGPAGGGPLSLGQQAGAGLKALHGLLGRGLRSVDTLGGRMPGSPAGSFITPESVNPIPRNVTEAGGQAAQLAIPGGNALLRILGQAAGSEGGSRLEGGTPWQGALQGGLAATVGETVGGLGGKLARSAPGAKGFIAAEDAANYGREMGRMAPALAGAKTVQDLQRAAGGQGREQLGAGKERAVQQIEGLTGNAPFSAPSLGPNPMTLREANQALTSVGEGAFNQHVLDRTAKKAADRRLWGEGSEEIKAGLGGQHSAAPGIFDTAQGEYKRGLSLLKPIQSPNAYRIGPNETQFNTPAIQQMLQNPKNAAAFRDKLGDANYEALLNVMTRGAGHGKDVLPPGGGHLLDAARQSFGRGTNTGSLQMLGVPLRTLLPNIGAQYAGRQPLSLPPALQQALDAVLQRQAGQMGGRD